MYKTIVKPKTTYCNTEAGFKAGLKTETDDGKTLKLP
ncbi:hypothetical protein DSUL_260032 [Desulfovibrionales bacterium]